MPRTLTLLFRRDRSRDRQRGPIFFEGYEILWPDGHPVTLGLDSFCSHGRRLLGLDRHLSGREERLIDLLCFPLGSLEDKLTRIPGHRVRRFLLQREGDVGRLYFLNKTPTDAVFKMGHDDPRVLRWLGVSELPEGGCQWVDLAARATEPAPRTAPALAAACHTFYAAVASVASVASVEA